MDAKKTKMNDSTKFAETKTLGNINMVGRQKDKKINRCRENVRLDCIHKVFLDFMYVKDHNR